MNRGRTAEPANDDRLEIPYNLGEWVDKTTLLNWIVADIDQLNWDNPELLEHLKRNPGYQPKLMLQLLTYAYATGTYGSAELETLYVVDTDFRTLGWDHAVTARGIVAFRRENRGLLKWTLVQLLQKALRTKFSLGDRLLPAGLKRFLVLNAIERIDLARHMDRGGAED